MAQYSRTDQIQRDRFEMHHAPYADTTNALRLFVLVFIRRNFGRNILEERQPVTVFLLVATAITLFSPLVLPKYPLLQKNAGMDFLFFLLMILLFNVAFYRKLAESRALEISEGRSYNGHTGTSIPILYTLAKGVIAVLNFFSVKNQQLWLLLVPKHKRPEPRRDVYYNYVFIARQFFEPALPFTIGLLCLLYVPLVGWWFILCALALFIFARREQAAKNKDYDSMQDREVAMRRRSTVLQNEYGETSELQTLEENEQQRNGNRTQPEPVKKARSLFKKRSRKEKKKAFPSDNFSLDDAFNEIIEDADK